jgi:hypothetical protein
LVDAVFITHVLLRLSMSPSVSHRGWSPGLLVPWSKPHVRPSPLLVHWHGTSLLDLHLTVDHCVRAPHLQTTNQETCCTTPPHAMVSSPTQPKMQVKLTISYYNQTTRAHINLVFADLLCITQC